MTNYEIERQLLHRMHVFINDPTDFHHRYLDKMIHQRVRDYKYHEKRRKLALNYGQGRILPRDI